MNTALPPQTLPHQTPPIDKKHWSDFNRLPATLFWKVLPFLVVALAMARLIHIDADPSIFKRLGDIGDEGYWVAEARNAVLFGKWMADDFLQGLATAPLYSLMAFGVFKVLGIHLYSVRLVPALAGCGSIFATYWLIAHQDRHWAWLAAGMLAINESFFTYNRLGHPESLVIFFATGSFALLFAGERHSSRLLGFLGGIVLSAALFSKITTCFFLPVPIVFCTISWRRGDLRKMVPAYFWGFALPTLAVLIFYYARFAQSFHLTLTALSDTKSMSLVTTHLVNLASNYYFSLPSVFLLVILILSGVGFRRVLGFLSRPAAQLTSLDRVDLLAICWLTIYPVFLLFSDCVDRRFTPLIVPLVILASRTLLPAKTSVESTADRPFLGIWPVTAYALPFILLLAHPINKLADRLAEHNGDLDWYKAVVAGVAILLVPVVLALLRRLRPSGRDLDGQAWLADGALYLALSIGFTWNNGVLLADLGHPLPMKIRFLAAVAVASTLLFSGRWPAYRRNALAALYAGCSALVIAACLFQPTYSEHNAQLQLAKLCVPDRWVVGYGAHFLALESQEKPLLWAPHQIHLCGINKDAMGRYRPSYILRAPDPDVAPDSEWPNRQDVGRPLHRLAILPLWPFQGRMRGALELDRIE